VIDFHPVTSPDAWRWAAAVAITSALRRRLAEAPRARLLVSGGGTPAPVFESLSQAPLEWDRVDVGLVDERWLAPGDPDTNAVLVRDHLLKGHAAVARFEEPHVPGESLEDAVARANARAAEPPAVMVLGMGGDGHTASLFPGMRGLEAALASEDPNVAVDARGCEGAGPWPTRISLTPAGMSGAALRLLLLRGEDKRIVFEQARSGVDPHEMPVRAAFELPGAPLQVYWTR
jgi:6-phosphogluconolactonase